MKSFYFFSISILTSLIFYSCNKNEKDFNDPLYSNRDLSVHPGDDFFQFANGNWFKNHPIPETESSNGIFGMIGDTIDAQIKDICEKSAKDNSAPKGSIVQKIGDFYASGLDTVSIEKNGLKPLQIEMDKIDQIKDIKSLMSVIAHLHTIGGSPAFSFYVGQDDMISTKYALFFGQGGLGLGNRDYYLNNDAETVNIRKEYTKHLSSILFSIGYNKETSVKYANKIINLETDLAKSSRRMEDLRDPVKNYNKMSFKNFKALSPNISWDNILPVLQISKVDTVIVGQPEFYKSLNNIVSKYDIQDWKVYLKWDLINNYAPFLQKNIEKQNFKFYSTVLNGVTKQKPRWNVVVDQTNESLGELIGQIYVKEYLPKGSKEKLIEIGNNVRNVFAEHIKNLDWMSNSTKEKALFKLSKIGMKVGYPDKWKDLSGIKISRQSYCSNVMEVNKWSYSEMVSKLGKPVDRSEWGMYPQTYNAYYDAINNEILVPACNILVPGFEGRMPDDAILYGIIGGSTFGHEMTHGFDDQGSQYDAYGNLNNWWTSEDLKKFKAKTKLIVNQFNKYEVLKGKYVNGEATQGENIADLGGVVMGLEAFKKTKQYKNKEVISGLNPEQRYFLAYGYAWMVNTKPKALSQQIIKDVHSPAKYRINGTLVNIPEFYKTFNIKKGNKMYLPENSRVVIW